MKARITFILAPKSDTQGEVWVNLVLENNNIQKVPLGVYGPFNQWDPMQEHILGDDEQTKAEEEGSEVYSDDEWVEAFSWFVKSYGFEEVMSGREKGSFRHEVSF